MKHIIEMNIFVDHMKIKNVRWQIYSLSYTNAHFNDGTRN